MARSQRQRGPSFLRRRRLPDRAGLAPILAVRGQDGKTRRQADFGPILATNGQDADEAGAIWRGPRGLKKAPLSTYLGGRFPRTSGPSGSISSRSESEPITRLARDQQRAPDRRRRAHAASSFPRHTHGGQSPDESHATRRQPGWQLLQTDQAGESYRSPTPGRSGNRRTCSLRSAAARVSSSRVTAISAARSRDGIAS